VPQGAALSLWAFGGIAPYIRPAPTLCCRRDETDGQAVALALDAASGGAAAHPHRFADRGLAVLNYDGVRKWAASSRSALAARTPAPDANKRHQRQHQPSAVRRDAGVRSRLAFVDL